MSEIKRFDIGKTYYESSICDYNCIFSFKIVKRTEKSVWVDVHGKNVRRSIDVYNGEETFKPFGIYSMCAIVGASKEQVTP